MLAVEDILTESLSGTVRDWFEPTFSHPFLNINIVVVPESVKQIPHRWVDDVQIDDLFDGGDGDVLGGLGGRPGTWTPEDGRGHLLKALTRLGLTKDQVARPNLNNRIGRNEYSAEKRRVKQELKRYDADFQHQFKRLPTHSEKEPMRPLYVYYRRLKTVIEPRGGDREVLANIPDTDETPQAIGKKVGVESQISALEVRIENLQSEKAGVRVKLQQFQEKFVTENNRKIRFHKDILPIEREYRMYKNLKEDIMKAESQLRNLRSEA